MAICFAGDIHGDTTHLRWVFGYASDHGAKSIVAAGDFGYWPHTSDGIDYISEAADLSVRTGITLFWIDGNHENHDAINAMASWAHTASPKDDPIYMMGDLWYIPRGVATDIDGRIVVGYGGAVSIDKGRRIPGHSWWDREAINEYHVDSLAYDTPVDILVTHEAPGNEHLSYKDANYREGVNDVWADSRRQRDLVSQIQQAVNPEVHVCGHHHVRKTWQTGRTTVHVLNCNRYEEESVLVL